MKRRPIRALVVVLIPMMPALLFAWGNDKPERIWILPFAQSQPDPAYEYLQDALPALLSVVVSGSGNLHAVVEREELNRVLGEQSLTLEGLTSPEAKQRVGKLLGATVMMTGSFVRQGLQLHVTVRATDLETGIVASTADGRGEVSQPGALVGNVYRRLAADLGRRLPELSADRIDDAPLSNLYFMKGLGHYYSARYSQSLAEFMHAAEDSRLTDISRLWLANAYLAQRQYSHACLELTRLMKGASKSVAANDVAAGMRECDEHLSREDLKMIREMADR